jgi:pyridoxal phosphate enzyme (YggS family)
MGMDLLEENIARVRDCLARASSRAGRNPAEVTLVAVSKTHPPERVEAAAAAGLCDFGENRVEEAGPKIAAVKAPGLRWHMIGHIQSRKAGDVIRAGFGLVHSVDSVRLAERLSRLAAQAGRVQPGLLECNVSGEESKEGFAAHNPALREKRLPEFEAILRLPGIRVAGLMTMAPIGPEPEAARPFFSRLRKLKDYLRINLPWV